MAWFKVLTRGRNDHGPGLMFETGKVSKKKTEKKAQRRKRVIRIKGRCSMP